MNGQPEYWLMRAELQRCPDSIRIEVTAFRTSPANKYSARVPQQTRRLIGLLLAAGKPYPLCNWLKLRMHRYPDTEGLVLSRMCCGGGWIPS